MLAFTPVFLIFSAWVLLGEWPGSAGLAGIVLIVLGAYLLHTQQGTNSLLAPFKALWREKGTRQMLGVALLFSLSSAVDKVSVINSLPFFWACAIDALMVVVLMLFARIKSPKRWKPDRMNLANIGTTGFAEAFTLLFHMLAVEITLVAYVISVKRASIFFAVILGYLIFREKNVRWRLAGATVMVTGIFLIALG